MGKDIGDVKSGVSSLQSQMEDIRKQQEDMQSIIDEKMMIASMKSASWTITYPPNDQRLKLSGSMRGSIPGTLDGKAVLCVTVSTTLIDSRVGPRHVTLYSKLSANTLVHPFYGLAEQGDRVLAVMKDLSACKTLGASLGDKTFTMIIDRVRIAYDLAHTLAYLHSVDILVRSLSDENILLVQSDGTWKPTLTNLDKARMVCL